MLGQAGNDHIRILHGFRDLYFPLLPWEQVALVEPGFDAVGYKAQVEGQDVLFVLVGVAEEHPQVGRAWLALALLRFAHSVLLWYA